MPPAGTSHESRPTDQQGDRLIGGSLRVLLSLRDPALTNLRLDALPLDLATHQQAQPLGVLLGRTAIDNLGHHPLQHRDCLSVVHRSAECAGLG